MENNLRKVLLVEGSGQHRPELRTELSRFFNLASTVASREGLRELIETQPDVVVLDFSLSSLFDIAFLDYLRAMGLRAPVLAICPVGQVRAAVQAIKHGASDVVEGAAPTAEIIQAVSDILVVPTDIESKSVAQGPLGRRQGREVSGDFGPIAGRSAAMVSLFKQVEQIASRETTVLITGESGTGKELIAREIHRRSARAEGPFVAINCAAIPETLIESELFGHEKGAFTHAVERRIGQFEMADGGTLLLDEIGELSLSVQVKLLRFLQEQEFFRVGRSKPISVNVRVLTATNRNLDELVRLKQFRQDLLYRINVINLHIPSLRDRADDIPRVIDHCLRKFGPLYGNRDLRIGEEVMALLLRYPWPGNVRELENVVEGLLALASSDEVSPRYLQDKIRNFSSGSDDIVRTASASELGFEKAERIFETDMIVKALRKASFIQTRAAELLGISRRILKYKMDKLGINDRGEVVESSVKEHEE